MDIWSCSIRLAVLCDLELPDLSKDRQSSGATMLAMERLDEIYCTLISNPLEEWSS